MTKEPPTLPPHLRTAFLLNTVRFPRARLPPLGLPARAFALLFSEFYVILHMRWAFWPFMHVWGFPVCPSLALSLSTRPSLCFYMRSMLLQCCVSYYQYLTVAKAIRVLFLCSKTPYVMLNLGSRLVRSWCLVVPAMLKFPCPLLPLAPLLSSPFVVLFASSTLSSSFATPSLPAHPVSQVCDAQLDSGPRGP